MEDDPAARELLREKVILRLSDAARPKDGRPPLETDTKSFWEALQGRHGREFKVTADVLAKDFSNWLRVPMDGMSYLHEAGGIRFGEALGFHFLVKQLLERCRGAFTDMSLQLGPDTDLGALVFQTMEDFNRYTSWSAIRKHLQCAESDSSSPSPGPAEPPTGAGSSNGSPVPGPPSI
jgi:hypothetical protein